MTSEMKFLCIKQFLLVNLFGKCRTVWLLVNVSSVDCRSWYPAPWTTPGAR